MKEFSITALAQIIKAKPAEIAGFLTGVIVFLRWLVRILTAMIMLVMHLPKVLFVPWLQMRQGATLPVVRCSKLKIP